MSIAQHLFPTTDVMLVCGCIMLEVLFVRYHTVNTPVYVKEHQQGKVIPCSPDTEKSKTFKTDISSDKAVGGNYNCGSISAKEFTLFS